MAAEELAVLPLAPRMNASFLNAMATRERKKPTVPLDSRRGMGGNEPTMMDNYHDNLDQQEG